MDIFGKFKKKQENSLISDSVAKKIDLLPIGSLNLSGIKYTLYYAGDKTPYYFITSNDSMILYAFVILPYTQTENKNRIILYSEKNGFIEIKFIFSINALNDIKSQNNFYLTNHIDLNKIYEEYDFKVCINDTEIAAIVLSQSPYDAVDGVKKLSIENFKTQSVVQEKQQSVIELKQDQTISEKIKIASEDVEKMKPEEIIKKVTDQEKPMEMKADPHYHVGYLLDIDQTSPNKTKFDINPNTKKPTKIFISNRSKDLIALNQHMLVAGVTGCLSDDTEVLTKDGWKLFKDVSLNEEVLTMNPKTFEMEYIKPVDKIDKPYKGQMIEFDGKDMNFSVTPDHKMFVKKGKKFEFVPAMKINSKTIFKRSGIWKGKKVEYFILDGTTSGNQNKYEPLKIKMDTWLEFMGWYLSEGSAKKTKDGHYTTTITQKKKENLGKIESCLSEMPFHYRKVKRQNNGGFNYIISDKQLTEYLLQFGHSKDKFIPQNIKELAPDQLKIFLNAYRLGDGTINKGHVVYYTSSKKMADDLQELFLKVGKAGIMRKVKTKDRKIYDYKDGKRLTQPRIIHGGGLIYIISEQNKTEPGFNKRFTDTKIKDYDGRIYCLTLPIYHLLYVRRDGKTMWVGNSGKTTFLNNLTNILLYHGVNMISLDIKIGTLDTPMNVISDGQTKKDELEFMNDRTYKGEENLNFTTSDTFNESLITAKNMVNRVGKNTIPLMLYYRANDKNESENMRMFSRINILDLPELKALRFLKKRLDFWKESVAKGEIPQDDKYKTLDDIQKDYNNKLLLYKNEIITLLGLYIETLAEIQTSIVKNAENNRFIKKVIDNGVEKLIDYIESANFNFLPSNKEFENIIFDIDSLKIGDKDLDENSSAYVFMKRLTEAHNASRVIDLNSGIRLFDILQDINNSGTNFYLIIRTTPSFAMFYLLYTYYSVISLLASDSLKSIDENDKDSPLVSFLVDEGTQLFSVNSDITNKYVKVLKEGQQQTRGIRLSWIYGVQQPFKESFDIQTSLGGRVIFRAQPADVNAVKGLLGSISNPDLFDAVMRQDLTFITNIPIFVDEYNNLVQNSAIKELPNRVPQVKPDGPINSHNYMNYCENYLIDNYYLTEYHLKMEDIEIFEYLNSKGVLIKPIDEEIKDMVNSVIRTYNSNSLLEINNDKNISEITLMNINKTLALFSAIDPSSTNEIKEILGTIENYNKANNMKIINKLTEVFNEISIKINSI